MEYRKLPHGEEQISILGLGTSSIGKAGEKEIQATVELALERGINFFDMASADAAPFPAYGRAIAGVRDRVYFQLHFGADYQSGAYGWTTELDAIKRSVSWQLEALNTDYIDFGFLHCLDEEADLRQVVDGGVLDYVQQLQREGVVRHIGLSSHTPLVANQALDLGILDLLMFSINPGYDYHHGDYAIGGADRAHGPLPPVRGGGRGHLGDEGLQRRAAAGCRHLPLRAGSDGSTSASSMPWTSRACSPSCPACGAGRIWNGCWAFWTPPRRSGITPSWAPLPRQRPPGRVSTATTASPARRAWTWALINKYYDLARAGDQLARSHYENLERHAGDCIRCGHCDRRCPFHVTQTGRMEEIQAYFGQ